VEVKHLQSEASKDVIRAIKKVKKDFSDKEVQQAVDILMDKWRGLTQEYVPEKKNADPTKEGAQRRRPALNKEKITKMQSGPISNSISISGTSKNLDLMKNILPDTLPKTSSPGAIAKPASVAMAKPQSVAKPAVISKALSSENNVVGDAKEGLLSSSMLIWSKSEESVANSDVTDGASGVESMTTSNESEVMDDGASVLSKGIKRKIVQREKNGILKKQGRASKKLRTGIRWRDTEGAGELCQIKEFSSVEEDVPTTAWGEEDPPSFTPKLGISSARELERLEGRQAFGREKLYPKIPWATPETFPFVFSRGILTWESKDTPQVIEYPSELLIPVSPQEPSNTTSQSESEIKFVYLVRIRTVMMPVDNFVF
jgi:hypothetical protein